MGIDDACILSVSVGRWERTIGKIFFFFFFYWMNEEMKDRQASGFQRKTQVVSKHNMGYINITRGSWGYHFTIGFGSESGTVPKVDLHFHYRFNCTKLSWAELCLRFGPMAHPTHLKEVISSDRYQPLTTLPLHQTSVCCITWRERHY